MFKVILFQLILMVVKQGDLRLPHDRVLLLELSSIQNKTLFSQERIQMANQLNVVEIIHPDSRGTIKMANGVVVVAKHLSIQTSMNVALMDLSKESVNVVQLHHHHHQTNVHV